MIARLLILLALLGTAPAAAQAPAGPSLAGSWALEMGGTTIFRFDLAQDASGAWHATWNRPSTFASDGDHFRELSGPVKKAQSATGLVLPDDQGVEVSFADPRPGAIPDIFDFRLLDPDAARMTYVGTGLAPYILQRVEARAPLGPWDPKRTYGRGNAAEGPETAPGDVPNGNAPGNAGVRMTQEQALVPGDTVTFDLSGKTKAPGKSTRPDESLPPSDANSFKLPSGAPVGR